MNNRRIIYLVVSACYEIDDLCYILGVVKRNPLCLHEIEWKNNGFLFTTPNILLRALS